MFCEPLPAIVIDNGTYMCKAGFSGDDAPKSIFPRYRNPISFCSVIGRPKKPKPLILGYPGKDCYVGDDALSKCGVLEFSRPIVDGIIENWDDMEKLWQHVFYNELRVDPAEQPVILTEIPHNPPGNREKMTHVMFENFGVPSLYVGNGQVFSLYSSGRITGLVLDAGEKMIHSVPIYEGHAIDHGIIKLWFGGRDLTDYFSVLLKERDIMFVTGAEREIIQDVKERHCYIALDFDEESVKSQKSDVCDVKYELPDGTILTVGYERFKCPETLFQPRFIGIDSLSIQDAIFESIRRCDNDLHLQLFNSVVLSGGSSMFDGIEKRLMRELTNLAPTTTNVHVIAYPERKYSSWIGGSIFASLPSLAQSLITKQDYEEIGTRIVHRKCF